MKFHYLCYLIVFAWGHAVGQQFANSDFQQNVDGLQQKDSLEAFTYAYLDEFLKTKDFSVLEEMYEKQWRQPKTGPETLALVILLSNEGYYRMRHGQIARAVDAYEEAWRRFQQYDFRNFDIIEYCLKPLGNAYSMLGDYSSAENIIKSYLLRAQQQGNSEQVVAALINLSIVYHDTRRHENAIEILEEAMDEEAFIGKAGLIHSNLAKNYSRLGLLRQARKVALQALKFFKNNEPHNNVGYLLNTYSTLAMVSLHEGDTTEALGFLKKASIVAEEKSGVNPREWAKLNVQVADIQAALGNYEIALAGYRKTLQQLVPAWDKMAELPNDDLLYAENTLKELFDGMAAVYVATDSLQQALDCYRKSFEVDELLKATFKDKESIYLQQVENRRRAEWVIELCYQLFLKSDDGFYLQQAFAIAERTKSIVLKDELNSRSTWSKLAGDSLWLEKQALTQQKAWVENMLIQEQLKREKADMTAIQRYIEAKNKLTVDLKALEQAAQGRLGRAGRQPEQLSIPALQEKLTKNGVTLVEYFFGAGALYVFVLDGSKLELHKVVAPLRKMVVQYSSAFVDEIEINADPKAFAKVSLKLYETLFPFRQDSTLLIVPDGLLNFIPFEALLTDMPGSQGDYSAWPWLLMKGPVLYQYSASSWLRDERPGRFSTHKMLGFFPAFENTERFLRYSEDEADHIGDYFEGDFFQDQIATKQTFLDHAVGYPVIHLSTHARAGGIYEPPSIAFIDSALYLPEIYGMNLETELLVLGACETGIGKLYKGEGPLSLANGFFHAGVRNIVLSLWKVNDYSTSQLMANFYRNYDEQRQPYRSLHQAKLDYLQNSDIAADKKSPYYWASFVYYGNTEVHQQREPEIYYYCLEVVAVLFLSVLVFWYYRIKKRGHRRRQG